MTQIFTNTVQNLKSSEICIQLFPKNNVDMTFHTKYSTKLKTVQICIYMPNKNLPISSECLKSSLNQSENRNNLIAKNMTRHRNPPLNYKCSAQEQVYHCKLRHQGCSSAQRQVFHCKLKNQLRINMNGSFVLLSASHSLFSI